MQAAYHIFHQEHPPTSWCAKKLIEMLVRKEKHCRGRGVKNQSDYLEQELINVILSKMALKPLKGDVKKYCQRGHDLEKIYSNQLMIHSQHNEFPFEKWSRFQN